MLRCESTRDVFFWASLVKKPGKGDLGVPNATALGTSGMVLKCSE